MGEVSRRLGLTSRLIGIPFDSRRYRHPLTGTLLSDLRAIWVPQL